MVSSFECPVCMNPYNFDTEHRAMGLACGHTVCRECISRMHDRKCPACRATLTTFNPNYALHDIMTGAAAEVSAHTRYMPDELGNGHILVEGWFGCG